MAVVRMTFVTRNAHTLAGCVEGVHDLLELIDDLATPTQVTAVLPKAFGRAYGVLSNLRGIPGKGRVMIGDASPAERRLKRPL